MSEHGTHSRDYYSPEEHGHEENGPYSQDRSHEDYRSHDYDHDYDLGASRNDARQEQESDRYWQDNRHIAADPHAGNAHADYAHADSAYVDSAHVDSQWVEKEHLAADYGHDQYYHSGYEDHHPADRYTDSYLGNHEDYQRGAHLPENHTDPEYFAPESGVEDRGLYRAVQIQKAQNRIRISDTDFMDVTRPKFSNLGTTMAGFAGVTAMLGLIGFLAFSSMPEMSPTDIISMQGYSGEQTTKTPFNLAELRGCDNLNDCNENTTTAQHSDDTTTIASSEQTNSVQTGLEQTGSEQAGQPVESQTYALNEIPLVTGHTVAQPGTPELREVPATTTRYVNVSDNGYSSIATDRQLQVSQQWSNVRNAPNMTGAIVKSLAQGTDVTVLSQTGNWFEIQVTNIPQIIGYMHQNTVSGN